MDNDDNGHLTEGLDVRFACRSTVNWQGQAKSSGIRVWSGLRSAQRAWSFSSLKVCPPIETTCSTATEAVVDGDCCCAQAVRLVNRQTTHIAQ